MSTITIFDDQQLDQAMLQSNNHTEIAAALAELNVRFERWETAANVTSGDSQEDIIAAYQADIDRLIAADGYQTVDVVSLNSSHPDKAAMRQKFLAEHTHSEDEVRFFVAGQGLFSLHLENKVVEVLCVKGDLISVPANTRHWFDMGPNPDFVAIRLFNNPDGWVASFTGSDIASQFSRLEN